MEERKIMKTKISVVLLLLCVSLPVFPHAGGHNITREQVIELSDRVVLDLAKRSKIETTWEKFKKFETAEQVQLKGFIVWRVTYSNKKASAPDKKRIYVFLTPEGGILGSSFTENPSG